MNTSDQPHERPVMKCKVCLKKISPSEDFVTVFHGGVKHPVCCASCAQKFNQQPTLYTIE